MTLEDLKQLYYLKKLINRNERTLKDLREQYDTVKSTTDYSKLKVQCSGNTGSKVESLALDITETIQTLALQNEQFVLEKKKLERYIDSVSDRHVQLILKLRFVDLLTWDQIAETMGGNNTSDSVRKICVRYLDKN